MAKEKAKEKKTYSLDSRVIAAVEREARLQGTYPSAYVNDVLLRATRTDDAKRLAGAIKDLDESDNNNA